MIDQSVFNNLTALYHTFGCKLNFAETSTIAQTLAERGIRRVSGDEVPDIVVVNTCSVTELSDKKCRQAIRSLHKRYPDAAIIATGCYAQLKADEVAALPGVCIVAGAADKMRIDQFLDEYLRTHRPINSTCNWREITEFRPSCSRGDRTRFFLKVQDGCDYYCSYCTIPLARGRSRNGSIASMVEQARQVAAQGGKEIVITGVNIGDFGKSTGETFLDLIRALDEVEGISRYRISSIEPNLLTDEIIAFVAQSKRFMPHFHIPLQSGSDAVLKLMRRRYDTALFAHRIAEIRRLMPQAFIGVDVIVGTRGETAIYFEESYRFLAQMEVTQLHVFSYSERPGTQALKIEHIVSPQEKHERSQRLLQLSEEKLQSFYQCHQGQQLPVLLERSKPGAPMHGFTPNYIRVEVPRNEALDNQLVTYRLGAWNDDRTALVGEPI